jgi:hypothetical protein
MPRIPLSDTGNTTADRVLGHRPELLRAWDELKHALLGPTSTLTPHLKEEVRRTLAQRPDVNSAHRSATPPPITPIPKNPSRSHSRPPSPRTTQPSPTRRSRSYRTSSLPRKSSSCSPGSRSNTPANSSAASSATNQPRPKRNKPSRLRSQASEPDGLLRAPVALTRRPLTPRAHAARQLRFALRAAPPPGRGFR